MATANDTIEKIYVLRGEGAAEVLKDLRDINQAFKDIAKAKKALEGKIPKLVDPAEVKVANDQLTELVKKENDLAVARQKALDAARAEIAINQERIGTAAQMAASLANPAGSAEGAAAQAAAVDTLTAAEQRLAETATVTADALADEVNAAEAVLSKTQQLAQIVFQNTEARKANAAALKENSAAFAAGTITEEQYTSEGIRLTAIQTELTKVIGDSRRELTAYITQNQSAEDSIKQLGAALGILRQDYYRLSAAERESASGKELLGNIKAMDAEVKRLEGSVGNFQRNVGNYKSAFDGLGNSVQQILRETPAAAVSLNTFFLAISNNIPQFFDEVKKIVAVLDELKVAQAAATAELEVRTAAQAAAAAAAKAEEDTLKSQVESLLQQVAASEEQAAAMEAQIAELIAQGTASVEAAAATATHTEALAINAGASAEDAAALGIQAATTAEAAAAAAAATVALEAQTIATTEATLASSSAPSVLARLGSSFFSVGTAVTLGVLALTLYGGKIFAATKEALGFNEASARTTEFIEQQAKALETATKSAIEGQGKEAASAAVLYTAATNLNLPMKTRLDNAKQLQDLYPGYLGNLSKEAIAAGDAATAYRELNEALINKVVLEVQKDQLKVLAEQQVKLTDMARQREKDREEETNFIQKQKNVPNPVNNGPVLQFRTNAQTGQLESYYAQANDVIAKQQKLGADERFDKQKEADDRELQENKRLQEEKLDDIRKTQAELQKLLVPTKQTKTTVPANQAREEYKGQKELNDALAELDRQRIEQDAQTQQREFENTKNSLDDRLVAYQQYQSDREEQASVSRQKDINNAKAELVAIQKLLDDPAAAKKRTAEGTNSLELQQKAARVRIKAAEERYQAELLEIARKGQADVAGIVKSDADTRLAGIEEIRAGAAALANDQLLDLQDSYNRGKISFKQYKADEKKIALDAHVYELNLVKSYLEQQISANQAAGRDTSAFQAALAQTNTALFDATRQQYDNLQKRAFDFDKFYKNLTDSVLQGIKSVTDAYIQEKQRQIDKDTEQALNLNQKEEQKRLDAAQSADERAAIEKEYDQKEEKLQKEAFERKKKLSLAELAIEFALASIKAISSALSIPGAGIFEAIAAEALVALEYAAKLAVLESAKFERGGEVPTRGGEFGGRAHSAGGTQFAFQGRSFEAEAEELAIINKRSARSNQKMTVTGTARQIASALNSFGGGVTFAPGASVRRFEYGGTLGATLPAPIFRSSSDANQDLLNNFAINTSAGFAAMNNRMDKMQVVLDPNLVQKANKSNQRAVDLGTL